MKSLTHTVVPKTVDDYLLTQPSNVRGHLEKIREAVKAAFPLATERISYQMPAFSYQGMLLYYAGWKNHIGFYPTASAIKVFQKELSKYTLSKGSVQFPLDKELPLKLIIKILHFKVKENVEKAEHKKAASKKLAKKSRG